MLIFLIYTVSVYLHFKHAIVNILNPTIAHFTTTILLSAYDSTKNSRNGYASNKNGQKITIRRTDSHSPFLEHMFC